MFEWAEFPQILSSTYFPDIVSNPAFDTVYKTFESSIQTVIYNNNKQSKKKETLNMSKMVVLDIWKFWLLQLGYQHLLSRGQGCCGTSFNPQGSPSRPRTILLKLSAWDTLVCNYFSSHWALSLKTSPCILILPLPFTFSDKMGVVTCIV